MLDSRTVPDIVTTSEELQIAASRLRSGGLVVLPTETVYGLGANALDPVAVARIFAAKQRPQFHPLIIHLADISWLERVAVVSPEARALAERFWPGPLTMVLPKTALVPEIVTGGLDSVGVRVPDHQLARQLIAEAGVPVAAPSANVHLRISPTTLQHARDQLGDVVDAYVEGGPCRVGVESTIVGWPEGRASLLRAGGIDPCAIEEVIGPLARIDEEKTAHAPSVRAPGMMRRHYAPRTPTFLEEGAASYPQGDDVALLCLRAEPGDLERFGRVMELAPEGDMTRAAARLFAMMHSLDAGGFRAIVARPVPDQGLGLAINDRMRRAAALP